PSSGATARGYGLPVQSVYSCAIGRRFGRRPSTIARSLHQGRHSMQQTVKLTVNGKPVSVTVDSRTLLVQLIRENLGLTGTHVGCDTAQCGACTIHMNGRAIKSCSILALQADGAEITTIEGLSAGGQLHPMQEAFRDCHALQCGFCTPGMVMSAVQLLQDNPKPSWPVAPSSAASACPAWCLAPGSSSRSSRCLCMRGSSRGSTATAAAAPATRTSCAQCACLPRAQTRPLVRPRAPDNPHRTPR